MVHSENRQGVRAREGSLLGMEQTPRKVAAKSAADEAHANELARLRRRAPSSVRAAFERGEAEGRGATEAGADDAPRRARGRASHAVGQLHQIR